MTNSVSDKSQDDSNKNKTWNKKKCRGCNEGIVFYKPEWTNPPVYCDMCLARKVDIKMRGLLLHIKTVKNKKILTDEDKKELAFVVEIENKLNQLKRRYENDERLIFEELIKIKEVQKILIEWGKHLNKSRAGTKKHHEINLGSGTFSGFVQGGATGLKK